jgi:hypothetical protein
LKLIRLLFALSALYALYARSGTAQAPTSAAILSGQELIYSGRFSAARLYFADLSASHPSDPVGPVLEASALIWWGEARGEEMFQAESIDVLLDDAVARARAAVHGSGADSTARVQALFWLGTALGYHARQAELRGNFWGASRHAKAMRETLEQALALDSSCVDCLLGLGVYEYALARAGSMPRLVARIIGLGGGDLTRGLERMRRAAEGGGYTRWEARWVYGNALLREGERDASLREEGLRLIGELALQFPDNQAFRRVMEGRVRAGP